MSTGSLCFRSVAFPAFSIRLLVVVLFNSSVQFPPSVTITIVYPFSSSLISFFFLPTFPLVSSKEQSMSMEAPGKFRQSSKSIEQPILSMPDLSIYVQ
jgi:hypothetical protein